MPAWLKWVIALLVMILIGIIGFKIYDKKALSGALGTERTAGEIKGDAVPGAAIIARQSSEFAAAPEGAQTQIMFGDLHVHSTYSTDAFLWSLPMNMGKGIHPVADACDYARYCSAMDFWAITDHAEASTPVRWARAKESIRQCQAKAGDQSNPDMVSMIGFEWTQVGFTPETHFGHKNVIFRDLDDDKVAARPIASTGITTTALRNNAPGIPGIVSLMEWKDRHSYWDFNTYLANTADVPLCDVNTPSNELPNDCYELAAHPGELLAKLEAQGLDPLVIPHGTSWGLYTPAGTSWGKQLKPVNRPEKMELIEIYSGHGNSEEYRSYRAKGADDICPPVTKTYTPSCQRAGEIIKERCLAEGTGEAQCETAAAEARDIAYRMAGAHHLAIKGESYNDWLDSGQCTDCYQPAFYHRPLSSVQAGLATTNFDGEAPARFNWGFISSSDNHRARPGTGYKEVDRRKTTEANGAKNAQWQKRMHPEEPKDAKAYYTSSQEMMENANLGLAELERLSGFWLTGGLAAVHSEGRSREQIWDAMKRRETYGTSGPRMLLWFFHENERAKVPMGSTIETDKAGTFSVRAAGSFRQKPGCPDYAVSALGQSRIDDLCAAECYNPSDKRNFIEQIHIIRIRPQTAPGQDLAERIDDPFLVHNCPAESEICDYSFTDESFAAGGEDALYYARAIQEPRPTINADPTRCEYDANGNCIKADVCVGGFQTKDGDCLTPDTVRAWSSPIYLNYNGAAAGDAQQ